jgi:hypothetical protein
MREKAKKTYESVVTSRITCDLCGKEIALNAGSYFVKEDKDEWRVTMRRERHEPDGGGEVQEYDTCSLCWESKIVALFGKPPTTV